MDFGIKDIFELLEKSLEQLFGGQIPSWVSNTIGWILLIISILAIILLILFIIGKIIEIWKEKIWPNFYDPDEKSRNLRRQRFAEHVGNEIRYLNLQEAWSDYRFAELEAEVEAEGERRVFSYIPFIKRTQSGLRREKSLSKALNNNENRIVLVEGEPGSGKSVALRHVTMKMAQKATKSRNNETVIPIFVNLKELRPRGRDVNRQLIYGFVQETLNRVNDRDVEEFLEIEFDRGLREGTWFFLFDSFDEIPEVLSSTEADLVISKYAEAISDFLHGMNRCKGVIASRQFRGPGQMGWPRIRILQLSESRQMDLIQNAGFDSKVEADFIGKINMSSFEIKAMASNPMFLGLICEQYRANNSFPENTFTVFETYINARLVRDEHRVLRRFGLEATQIRDVAEKIAFGMAADPGLGLSPTRQEIIQSFDSLKFDIKDDFHKTLDALEFMKLARSETGTIIGESRAFTFAHRRFQEYFATSIVLREPVRVSSGELLTNAKWRETAVVLFQTRPVEELINLFNTAYILLSIMIDGLPEIIADPLSHVKEFTDERGKIVNTETPKVFPWPAGSLHLLSLFQSGFITQPTKVPKSILHKAEQILLSASVYGTIFDKKWALEVSGILRPKILTWLIRQAFNLKNQWIRNIAYQQAAWLGEVPDDVSKDIRKALLGLFAEKRLREERFSTIAHLKRLPDSKRFLNNLQLLLWIQPLDTILHLIVFSLLVINIQNKSDAPIGWIGILAFVFSLLILSTISLPTYVSYVTRPFEFPLLGYGALSVRWFLLPPTILFIVLFFGELRISFWVILLAFPLWAPLMIMALESRLFVRPITWPLVYFYPLLFLFTHLKELNNKMFWKSIFTYFLYIIPPFSLIGLTVLLGDFVSKFFPQVSESFFVLGYFASVGLTLVVFFIYDSIAFCSDWFMWNKRHKRNLNPLSGEQFLKTISTYKTRWFRKVIITHIKKNELLLINRENNQIISKLLIIHEHARLQLEKNIPPNVEPSLNLFFNSMTYQNKYYKSLLQTEDDPLFRNWLEKMKSKKGLFFIELKFWDEVYALFEQVNAKLKIENKNL